MKFRPFLCMCIVVVLLAPEIAAAQRNRTRVPAEKGSLYYTRVIASPSCMVYPTGAAQDKSRALGLLAGPLMSIISPLISSGVDAITSRMQRIKEEFSASDNALGDGVFYRENGAPMNYCITIVRGEFASARNPAEIERWASDLGAVLDKKISTGDAKNLGLAARPDLYAEFHIRYHETPAAFEIVPKLIDYHTPLAKRTGSNGKLVSFAFRFDAVSSDDQGNHATFAIAALPGVRLFANTVYAPDTLDGLTTGFNAAPRRTDLQTDIGAVPSPVPFNIIATVGEAEEPSILAEIVANSAVAIGANLKSELIGAAGTALQGDGR